MNLWAFFSDFFINFGLLLKNCIFIKFPMVLMMFSRNYNLATTDMEKNKINKISPFTICHTMNSSNGWIVFKTCKQEYAFILHIENKQQVE